MVDGWRTCGESCGGRELQAGDSGRLRAGVSSVWVVDLAQPSSDFAEERPGFAAVIG